MALTVSTINTAIEAILENGQTVSVDGMSYSRTNLKDLYDLRDRIRQEGQATTRPTMRAFNFGNMGY